MLKIDLERLATGFSTETGYCYVHARATELPNGEMVMTMQKLRLSGSDIFSGLEMTRRNRDGGWSPIEICPALSRRPWQNGIEVAMCDATPVWHRATGTLLLTGHTVLYKDDEIAPLPPRHTSWSVFDETSGGWQPYELLAMPDGFENCGAGCTQLQELADGTLLIPVYALCGKNYVSLVMHCSFDGRALRLLEYGPAVELEVPRGLYEPSLICHDGRFFMCMRNDQASYVSVSEDGLHYAPPVEWKFDDGTPLGSYNTQQHWLEIGGRLYLVYTRRGANNDHIFRHRAPLFIAEVDAEKFCVKRETEQVAVPARGARLGNFCCAPIQDGGGMVVAAEWMQTTEPDCGNFRRCMQYGSDNSIFIARITQ